MLNLSLQRLFYNIYAVAVAVCLLSLTGIFSPLQASNKSAELVEKVLAIQADSDYGEYLASECMTCHKAEASDSNIPVIHGKNNRDLVVALLEYKNKQRENETMRSVAGALGDEEIAALAAYLSQL